MSLLDTMVLGRPCNLTTSSRKSLASLEASVKVATQIRSGGESIAVPSLARRAPVQDVYVLCRQLEIPSFQKSETIFTSGLPYYD